MAVTSLLWKLASPYDAYVSHVARLNEAISRVRYSSERALGYEAGLQSSVRFVPGQGDPIARAKRFREQMGEAAGRMSDEEFEDFLAHLGGGSTADVEVDRAKAFSRMGQSTRGLEEYFSAAARELALLESRGYSPSRPDVARQLRDNDLPLTTVEEYRHLLHQLGTRVGQKV